MPNRINLYGDIGEGGITCQMVKTQLARMDQTQPLEVHIDSFGGVVFDGLSMYEAFASYPGPKKAVIETSAFSIASYIAMAFDEVEIASNGYMMIHSPYLDGAGGTPEDLVNMAELGVKLRASMVTAYATKAGISEQDAQELMAKDTYLNAEEALSKGLVNRINEVRAKPRTKPQARHQNMPHRVFASLFGDGSTAGEGREPTREQPMSESPKVVAATLQEIEAAFPKAKAEFVLGCLKRQLPMASVATAAVEEMMTENAALKAEVEELKAAAAAAASAKAEGEEEVVEEEATEAKAKARGVAPVARAGGKVTVSARAQWNETFEKCVARCGGDRAKAARMANRENPGLRESMLAEANAAR